VRIIAIIPAVIAATAAAGVVSCKALSVEPHVREMLFAAGACLIASEGAMVPIILTRGASQFAVVQAALVGTIIHLFGCTALAGVMILTKSLGLANTPLLYWLFAFYWLTLIVVVTALVKALRAAPMESIPSPRVPAEGRK